MLLCGGNAKKFRTLLIENGATVKVFKPGDNIVTYLDAHGLAFMLEEGMVSSKVTTADASEHFLFAVKPGSILPKFPNCFHCKITPFEELSPVGGEAKCLVLPAAKLLEMKSANPELAAAIDQDAYSIISALAIAAVAFHSGEGLNRVANFLYCMHNTKTEAGYVVDCSQEDIAAATNLSASQVWRVLTTLKKEEIVTTSGGIAITDLEKLKSYVSEIVLSYTCFTHN